MYIKLYHSSHRTVPLRREIKLGKIELLCKKESQSAERNDLALKLSRSGRKENPAELQEENLSYRKENPAAGRK
jgi:hypothetical protein